MQIIELFPNPWFFIKTTSKTSYFANQEVIKFEQGKEMKREENVKRNKMGEEDNVKREMGQRRSSHRSCVGDDSPSDHHLTLCACNKTSLITLKDSQQRPLLKRKWNAGRVGSSIRGTKSLAIGPANKENYLP
ncbi:hypothetical protein MTR_7g096030 [Medicago truncatula]|uniref:Uncharacterized protein n=1 Tax=Medicago truncatula TaxID=3880 RepID=A0A072U2D1_MEDTR|nr:hypothetical protein MTR_7g096030 [Medicago truncatula]